MVYVLGVDGGNSKTVALVGRADGSILGSGRSGCSDIYAAASAEAALQAVEHAVHSALREASIPKSRLVASAFSMAGADWPEDHEFLEAAFRRRGFGRNLSVVNDALGALRGGSPDGTGVVVVCGTGAATGGRGQDGRVWHSSWWQETQGSRHLAQKTLHAIYRAELGIDRPTSLTSRVLEIFERETVLDVLHLFTARGGQRPHDLSRVTCALLDEAERGDQTAGQIVRDHGRALGDYAVVAAHQVGIADLPFALVLAGGVLRHSDPSLSDAIIARVRGACPDVQPVTTRFEPAVGALLLALEAAGICVDSQLLGRVEATLAPPSLFAT